MLKTPQKTINKTALKHYNQSRSVITEALRWLQITTDIGKKIKVETETKQIHHKLLDFIKIDIINVERKKSP